MNISEIQQVLDEYFTIGELLILIILFLNGVLTLTFIYTNARFNIRNKQEDMIIHFHKQYDVLQMKRVELLIASKERENAVVKNFCWSQERLAVESDVLFDRFWSLQFDEFVAWYEGYVPTNLYLYWVFSRWRELHVKDAGWEIAGKNLSTTLSSLSDRWKCDYDSNSKRSMHVRRFLDLMRALKNNPSHIHLEDHLCEFGPHRFARYFRTLFGA